LAKTRARSPPWSGKHRTQNARVAGAIAKLSAKVRPIPICATAAKAWLQQNEPVIPSEVEGSRCETFKGNVPSFAAKPSGVEESRCTSLKITSAGSVAEARDDVRFGVI